MNKLRQNVSMYIVFTCKTIYTLSFYFTPLSSINVARGRIHGGNTLTFCQLYLNPVVCNQCSKRQKTQEIDFEVRKYLCVKFITERVRYVESTHTLQNAV